LARWNKPKSARSSLFLGVLRVAAYGYPLTLLALCLGFTLVGERHWLSAGLLYAPRVAFAAPLVVLLPALWLTRHRSLLWTQVVALAVLLVPLMGLVLPWPGARSGARELSVLSYNIDSANAGASELLAVVDRLSPDLVLFQEASWDGELDAGLQARFRYFDHTAQFVTASRYPIEERTPPPREESPGHLQRSMRYLIDSSLGKLAVYSLHPVSPRGTVRRAQLRDLLRGEGPDATEKGSPESELTRNAAQRERQIAEATARASREAHPVLLAGDTNLPGASRALRVYLGPYRDGFERASWGFGYTFPARRPFLRLDRILADGSLDFSEFRVGCPDASDHCWVWARLFRR